MEGEVASEVSPGDREGIQERDENEEEGGQVENRCQEAEANAGDLRPPVAVQDGRASTGSSCVKAAAPSDVENSQSSHLSSEEDLLCSPGASSVSSLSFLAFAHAASSVSSLGRQSTSSDASSPLPSSSSTNPSASSESSASSSSASSSFSHSSSLPASSCSGSSSASSSSSPSSSPSTSSSSCAASSAASSSLRSSVPGGVGSESDTGRQAGRLHAMSLHVAEAVCSEQVVLGLKSICKELVENAVDAGATTVEVRFVDGGMASVEVRDNGSGIAPQDFPMLGRRHATSKINKFADLYSALDTLGFRGEALASLCALSDVEILTRTASEPFATRLRFDHHGKIIHQEPAAREVGTSVTVSNLFASLPLRRRALQQQRQKHLQESLAFLQKFALLHADDCRVLVTDFTPANTSRSAEASGSQRRNGGNCVTLLNTRGTATRLMDAAVTVYGERQMQQCSQVSLAGSEEGREWSVEVLLSRPPLGVRTSALQLFFVNKRVVEFPPLLQKLINKKYREVSSRHCFPIVIAFATVAPHLLEVNLRKDKQEVLLAVEKEITEALLKTITDFVAPTVASFQTARGFSQVFLTLFAVARCSLGLSRRAEREREEGEKGDEAEGKRREEADDFGSFEKRRIERKGVPSRTQLKRREDEFVSENKLLKETIASAVAECHCTDEDLAALYGASDAENDKETQHEPVASSSASPAVASFCISECPAAFSFASSSDTRVIGAFDPGTSSFFLDKRAFSEMKVVGQFNQGFIIGCLVSQVPSGDPPVESGDSHEFRQAPQTPQLVSPSSLSASPSSSSSSSSSASSSSSVPSASPASKREVRSVFIVDQHASDEKKRFEDLNAAFKPATQPLLLPLRLHLPVDMARAVSDFDREIRANGFRVKVARERSRVHAREERDAACAAEASEDAADAPLEEETVISLLGLPVIEGRQLKEEDFIEFVASLLHDEEGHATAARWRRRRRKKRRKRTPELAQKKGESPGTPEKPSEETVARGGDNTRGPQAGDDEVDVKHGSGSEGGADEDESDEGEDESEAEEAHAFHHRVLLCRPKKVWEILASRACRSAIMIGDSLTVNQMQTVLKNLATLHLPFNCPHGRPTVRHLFDLHLPAVYPPEREVRRVPWERQRGAEEAAADDGEAEDAARGDAGKGAEELGNVEERAGSERTKEEMEATGNWRGRRAERQRLKGVDASSPDKQKGRGEERREEKHETEGREEEGDVVGGRFKVRRKRCREEKKRGEKRRKKKKVEQATGLEEDLSAEQHRELTKAQAHRREEKEHHEIFAEEKGLFDEDDPDVVADGEETNEQKCLSLRDWKADDRCLDAASSRPPQMKLYELSFEAHK
ncbi:UNVERIFIED_CONTAM: DNA mismatch repair protein, C-terminal domain-containing protein [Hammondia hammondi]|eukprot:XP_008885492.1 DNA mismatch repair protein, C-terminal domain-containing protein [Hammondia hammondi]